MKKLITIIVCMTFVSTVFAQSNTSSTLELVKSKVANLSDKNNSNENNRTFSSSKGYVIPAKNSKELDSEPPTRFLINSNKNVIVAHEGDSVLIGKNWITIELAKTKTFEKGIVSFEYPSNFVFTYMEFPQVNYWFMEGLNYGICYTRNKLFADIEGYIDYYTQNMKRKQYKIEETNTKINGISLSGKKVTFPTSVWYFYNVEFFMSEYHVLILKDFIPKNEVNEEKEQVKKLLNQSFRIIPKRL